MNYSKLNNIWEEVLLSLKNKLQDNNIFNTFFQDSKLYEVKDDTAYISVKTKFAKELLGERYLPLIEKALEQNMNYDSSTAYKIAISTDRNFMALRRLLANNPLCRVPNWARLKNKNEMIPLMLMDEIRMNRQCDVEILKTLVGENYDYYGFFGAERATLRRRDLPGGDQSFRGAGQGRYLVGFQPD